MSQVNKIGSGADTSYRLYIQTQGLAIPKTGIGLPNSELKKLNNPAVEVSLSAESKALFQAMQKQQGDE